MKTSHSLPTTRHAFRDSLLGFWLGILAVHLPVPAFGQANYSTPYTFTTLAGNAGYGSADGTGSAARFYDPSGVAVDSAGNVYVADTGNSTIRKVTLAGVETTLAGLAGSRGSADETGSAARFSNPNGVAVGSAGNVYVADTFNRTIRKVTPAGLVTTLAGLAGSSGSADGTGSAARFNDPYGVAVDSAGNVYVADYGNNPIRKVTPAGVVTTLAGLAGSSGSADGTGSAARFYWPNGVAVDSAGNVFVADKWNDMIRKVTPAGVVTTLAGLAGSRGSADGTGSATRFNYPSGVAVDSAGNVYVADTVNSTIRKVTPAGLVTTLAGLAGSSGSADGTGSAARFNYPSGVAVDSAGNVYVADSGNNTIRKGWPTSGGVGPAITGQPQNQTAAQGANVTLRVFATGMGQLFYQWEKNGVTLPGQTAAVLTFSSVSPSDSGGYSVVVWNAYGSAVSATAYLAVLADGANGAQPKPVAAPASPTKAVGVDSLVIITHGWQPVEASPIGPPPLPAWVTELSNAIRARAPANWQVECRDWTPDAWTLLPDSALGNAKDIGTRLGREIAAQAWQHVHLIGHSAGAGLIQAAADAIRAAGSSIVVQTTFLDPYLGLDYHGLSEYGRNADWADCYFSHDNQTGSFTEGPLAHAYNVDVTWVDGDKTTLPVPCPSTTAESTPPVLDQICGYQAWSSHDWPHEYYLDTVLGAGLACNAGYTYGFPLSKEGGGWDSRGNRLAGDDPLVPCGQPSVRQNPFPLSTDQPLQLSLLPNATSASGVNLFGNGATLSGIFAPPGPLAGAGGAGHVPKDGPPVSTNASPWLAVALSVTNAVNFLTFDADFIGTNGGQGLLTVYWNTNQIGMVDERGVSAGLQTYRFALPGIFNSGLYTLSFRLDTFTNVVSSITVTNVATGFVGISEPLNLEMLLWGSNSVPVLKLTGAPGYNYVLESSTNLVNWTPTALLVNTNGAVWFADPAMTNSSGRFYRAVMP